MNRSHTRLRLLGWIVGAVLTLLLAAPAQALSKDKCSETKGPPPQASVKNLRELEANTGRPTFKVPLDSGATASDDITLPVKGRKKIGKTARAASARVDQPRRNERRLKADIRVSAQPTDLGTGVVIFACISNKSSREAGTYEGTIDVYGPRFNAFSYPIVVTTKWPVWVPLAIIITVLVVFLFFEVRRKETGAKGSGIYLVIALAAGAITYFAQYDSAETWGDAPGAQLSGLAVAVVTAAAAGRAAAKKFFSST
jgi:hypothetical protein